MTSKVVRNLTDLGKPCVICRRCSFRGMAGVVCYFQINANLAAPALARGVGAIGSGKAFEAGCLRSATVRFIQQAGIF